MKGTLLLEDGTFFEGLSLGIPGERWGEVILYTGVVGYQEVMTDPANAGKILVFTYPLIGNYGVARRFNESKRCWIGALIIKEESRISSNWQAEDTFPHFLHQESLVALGGVDTRTLAVKIRDDGQMLGIASTGGDSQKELKEKLTQFKGRKGELKPDSIGQTGVNQMVQFNIDGPGPMIAILDLGILNSFLKQLKSLGCRIQLLPSRTSAKEILALEPDGLIISGGPEEDGALPLIVETVRDLLGKIPLLGLSTGHQVICRALGGEVRKMKVGHHGANYPVAPPSSHQGDITFQNHSWVVDTPSIEGIADLQITLRNVNDLSLEEIASPSRRFISAQYYPLSPGFEEVHPLFPRFLQIL